MGISIKNGASLLALTVAIAALSGCALPRSGPSKSEIYAGSVLRQGDAYIVSVNSAVNRATAVTPALGFSDSFRKAGVIASDMIAPGDKLSIVVYENVMDDPLLGSAGQRGTPLQEMQVDGQGYIFIPYAGRIRAAGQTPEQLRQTISSKLDSQTPDPQVSVSRVAGDGATVSVAGAVGSQGIHPIERPTRTLSAMILNAGGVSIDPSVAKVRVTRGNQSGQIWLEDLYTNPSLDIALRPGDQIVVERDTRSYVTLGATSQTRVQFETQTLSAIEALAQVGGLNTGLADPTGVFVFRNEAAEIANAVLGRNDLRGAQRMVYVLDLTKPTGMFEARDFLIRDGDLVYITEAPFVQWQKTLSALTGTVGSANSLASIAEGN